MCLVFLQAQTFALRGGPSSRRGVEQVNGFYSGVLTEISGGTDLGLFLLTASVSGASNGQIVFFSSDANNVNAYGGTITGLSNPNSGQFLGIFGATDVNNTTGSQSISGQLVASAIKANVLGSSAQQLIGTGSARTISITGNGLLVGITRTVSPLKIFVVSGWQSNGEGNAFALFGG